MAVIPTHVHRVDEVLGGGLAVLDTTGDGHSTMSATILLRGRSGAGKTVMALEIAHGLAKYLSSDVLYVCEEILPVQILHQFCTRRDSPAISLAWPDAVRPQHLGPVLAVGTQRDVPRDQAVLPDIGATMLRLHALATKREFGNIRVVVYDALSDGYGTASAYRRQACARVCELAMEQGWFLILLEEIKTSDPLAHTSDWAYPCDTVMTLDHVIASEPSSGRYRVTSRYLHLNKSRYVKSDVGYSVRFDAFPDQ